MAVLHSDVDDATAEAARITEAASVTVAGALETREPTIDREEAAAVVGIAASEVHACALAVDGRTVAQAGPVVIKDSELAAYWGDLHGQSGETIGIGRIEDYMNFARNKAFLDAMCHQGNDFQIKRRFWDHLNHVTAEWNEPGRFTTFPGYEWSGNTAVGGDRNVIYANEGCTLRRCSHALLEQRDELEHDAHTISDLYAALRKSGEDTVIFAHVGGRYANIEIDHDADLETAVETNPLDENQLHLVL